MRVEINLSYNKGFKWFSSNSIYVKGYLFDTNNNLYKEELLIKYFENINTIEEFKQKLIDANGIFSVVIKQEKQTFIAVDRTRTFPIFYAETDDAFYISDDIFIIKNKINTTILNISSEEFLLTGYVSGKDTLFKKIYQIESGELIFFHQNRLHIINYHNFVLDINYNLNSIDKIYQDIEQISNNIFNRLINYANGRTLLIPLSGGYDSRYIIVMLKKLNYQNIIAFTYGKKDSPEVKVSKKIANILDVKHYFIEYNYSTWEETFSDSLLDYFFYSFNGVSLTHIQDIYAITYLHRNNILPKDTIVVPGHSGDLIGGSHIRAEYDILKKDSKFLDIKEIIYLKYYGFKEEDYKKVIFKKLEKQLKGENAYNSYSFTENWNIKNRQSKYIINSCRLYEYYGYKFLLPLWDIEITDYFISLPLKYRVDNIIYNQYLEENLFKKFKINFLKKEPLYKNYYIQNIKNMLPLNISKYLKNIYVLFKNRKNDVNNFNLIDNILLKDINHKDVRYKDFKELLGIWIIDKVREKDIDELEKNNSNCTQ